MQSSDVRPSGPIGPQTSRAYPTSLDNVGLPTQGQDQGTQTAQTFPPHRGPLPANAAWNPRVTTQAPRPQFGPVVYNGTSGVQGGSGGQGGVTGGQGGAGGQSGGGGQGGGAPGGGQQLMEDTGWVNIFWIVCLSLSA
jgi:uncharacterized membrane protein YgcG